MAMAGWTVESVADDRIKVEPGGSTSKESVVSQNDEKVTARVAREASQLVQTGQLEATMQQLSAMETKAIDATPLDKAVLTGHVELEVAAFQGNDPVLTSRCSCAVRKDLKAR